MAEYTPPVTRALMTTETAFSRPAFGLGVGAQTTVALSLMEWLAAEDKALQNQYLTYREYYDGEHAPKLTERMRSFLEIVPEIKFDLNYIPVPIDTLSERLRVNGFEAGEQSELLWKWWNDNGMDAVQGDVHQAQFRDGDTYVLVEWDNENGRPVFCHELAFDGTSGVTVRYTEERAREMKFAVKRWRVESGPGAGYTYRMNVYTPAAIYKYITGRHGWQEFVEPDGAYAGLWPIPWQTADGQPLGVPVVHFRNNAGGYDFGRSEMKDLIPAQNALNKSVIDVLAVADTMGFNWPTLSGGMPPVDESGEVAISIGPGKLMYSEKGTWGYIPPSDISKLSGVVNDFIIRMAQISRTPLSYFQVTGQVARAETQKANDTSLVSKAENRATAIGNSWETAMKIARRLQNAFGVFGIDEEQPVETIWHSFERGDKAEEDAKQAETNDRKSQTFERLINAGVMTKTAALLAGYTEDEAMAMAAGQQLPGAEL